MGNDFLVTIVHDSYSDEEIKAAFAEISSSDLVKHLDYLIVSLEVSRATMVWAKVLISKIEGKDVKGRLIDFIEYQRSEDRDIREVTASLAHNKIDEQELIDNFEALVDYPEPSDEDVQKLTFDLALSINPKKIRDKIDFLREKELSKNADVRKLAERLIKNIDIPPCPKKTRRIVEMILS